MRLLAAARLPELEAAFAALQPAPVITHLRQPETGLAMVRGRAGGTGAPFNLGEMTVTRCAVRLAGGEVGICYAAGRDPRHAELAAMFDGLLQSDPQHSVARALLDAIAARRAAEADRHAAQVAATRVEFYTMVREQQGA
jgi:alpha-D-ribose 1-methylphosphonate 5-triphosphate synthase subunit PhnG